jgi:flavin-dependent dehydrogenase
MEDIDVIIVGASFAGLAVANQLSAQRVLLIDRKPVGSGQTSACGTILQVLQNWDLTESVLQKHDSIVLHTARNSFEFPSPYPWCTFDYRHLCESLFDRSGADFLQAAVIGYDGESVNTSQGNFRARYVVDASGWRAVIASALQPGFARKNEMNFGIETIGSLPNDAHLDPTNLHFWYDPAILKSGVGWVFPRGETASFGVGSYRGATHLRRPLTQFVDRLFIQPNGLHGTYFPQTLRNPIAGRVFVVGDAAGMCIGLTGEGIRPALFFGETCGRIVRRVLVGKLTLEAGLAEYTDFVEARRFFFQIFSGAQDILSRVPVRWIDSVARFLNN